MVNMVWMRFGKCVFDFAVCFLLLLVYLLLFLVVAILV